MPDEKSQEYTKISVSLRKDILERLDQLTRETGLGRSAVISLAISKLPTREEERKRSGD
ncbi:MAG: ribbon-helix-helix protein, CopG family [Anaerolineae bacterium]